MTRPWEEELEELLLDNTMASTINGEYWNRDCKEIKNFIKKVEAEAEERGQNKVLEKLEELKLLFDDN